MEKMETHQAAGDEQQICRRNSVKFGKCKNVSGDNSYRFCDFHYIILTDSLTKLIEKNQQEMEEKKKKNENKELEKKKKKELEKKKKHEMEEKKKKKEMEKKNLPPPDGQRCCHTGGNAYRCKNFRMGHGGDDDDSVPKRRHCEKHYNYYVNKYRNLKSGDDKLKTRKKVSEGDDCSLEIQPQTKNTCFQDMNLPPDEQRCCRTDGTRWRCKNFRMGHGNEDSVRNSRYCQQHYNDRVNYLLKKRNGDGTRDSNCSKPRKEENDCSLDVTGMQPPTSDAIVGGGSANIGSGGVESLTGIREIVGTKRKNVERTEWSGELDFTDFLIEKPSLITLNEMKKKKQMEKKLPPDEEFCCVHTHKWRCKNVRMGYGAADDDASVPKTKFCEKHYNYYAEIQDRKKLLKKQISGDGEGATGPFKRKRKTGERTEGSGEPVSSYVEIEKRKLECTKLPRILLGEMETRKTAAKVEPEEWNKSSDLESRSLRVENENSTKRCVISNLESLVQMNAKESSTLKCVGLGNSEKIKSEAWGLQNEVTPAGEKHNTSKPNAETTIGGRKDSHVFELKTKENVHGIGINKHHESEYEFQNYAAANTSEDSDSFTDSEGSLGALMDMLAMKYRNRNEDREIKWKFEADMLSSFEVEPELCLKAVCALCRQHMSEISANGLFHYSDARRCTSLAKFLMAGTCNGDLNKSVKELEMFDSKGVEDCKRLATSYSKQLFSIYQSRKDPYFLPATTLIHGDQIAQ